MNEYDDKKEREIIIEKYLKGREKLEKEEIKDWEDPTFSLYEETDRYGFIHSNKLPEKMPEYENKLAQQENSRLKKWLKMIQSWDQYYPNSEKLRKRVYKGIPDALRGKVWPKLMKIEQLKQEQEGVYDRMLEYGMEESTDIRQIDLDVNRTYRNHRIFRERYNIRQQMLFKVLVAYSVYNTEVGYCQGMSQIAALLLMYMDEEDAFWCLSTLMSSEPYRMHGFFIPGFPKLTRFSKHHDEVVKRFLPRVSKHFKKFGIDSTLYTLKWFFQCFLDRVPFSLTLRIWDVFLLEGEDVLTGMSYTLLKLHKRSILTKSMDDTIQLLQVELEKDFGYHDDSAITELQRSMNELKKHKYLHPGETPEEELPAKEFGKLAFKERIHLGDDRNSLAGSILLRPETYSTATSRTSDADSDAGSKISVYDNVSLNESIEAAKALSASKPRINSSNSHHKNDNSNVNDDSTIVRNSSNSPQNHSTEVNDIQSNNKTHTNSNKQSHQHDVNQSSESRKEQIELIEKIAKLNRSVSENEQQVFIQKSEKTFIVEDHRSDEVVKREFASTKSTFISVNNFTIEDSVHSEHQTTVQSIKKSPRIETNTNGKIEHHQSTSPSKIRIFVPYSETTGDDDSQTVTAKGLPAVET